VTNRTGQARRKAGPSFDPDIPVAGCYSVRLVKGGPPVALLIWFGLPVDPLTGEEMDRAPRWNAVLNGVTPVDVGRFWPSCAANRISLSAYHHIVDLSRTMDPSDPYFDPMKPVDRSTAKPPF